MALSRLCLLKILVIGYVMDLATALNAGKPVLNMESIFADNEGLYDQYQKLNTVVKRESKGSCSCTCETKPVIRYTNDNSDSKQSDKNKSSAQSGDHAAKLLRTGSAGSQHPVWSMADSKSYKDTAEVDGHNQLIEGRPSVGSRTYDSSDQSDDQQEYYGNDWNQAQPQHAPSAADSGSDISWGHGSRFPWLHLPNEMCFRKQCSSNLDCCRKFNLCDRSASVCVDCWYGSTCSSEAQCCEKFPYCEMMINESSDPLREPSGRCVDTL